MVAAEPFPDAWFEALAADLAGPGVVALALTGSHARGDATPHSDVDILRFLEAPPATGAERYTLLVRDGRLVSLSTATIAGKREELARPESAIFAVPGLRQMRILRDPTGALAALRREAEAFRWGPLEAAADDYAGETAMGCAEEVHKLLGALGRDDESALAYGTLGLWLGLTRAVAVQRGLLVISENTYFAQVQAAVGEGAAWAHAFRRAGGLDAGPPHVPPARSRALAGLALYRETVALLRPILRERHLPVIEQALARIAAAGYAPPA